MGLSVLRHYGVVKGGGRRYVFGERERGRERVTIFERVAELRNMIIIIIFIKGKKIRRR